MLLMHREILGLKRGDKKQVDHINGNCLDNTKSNLRLCTNAQNQANQKLTKRNTSGFKGVLFLKKLNSWKAKILHNKKSIHIGVYKTPQKAAKSYDKKALEIYGEFALTNEKMGLLKGR